MSLAVLADHMASKGRGPDSMLIHMSPREVQGLQALAMKHGGSLTINPDTGLPEAGFLDKLLPAIIGFGVSAMTGLPAWQIGLGVGAVETARTGDLGRGISAGLGAYGGAGIGAGMSTAGSAGLTAEAATAAGAQATQEGLSEAAKAQMIDEAARAQGFNEAVGQTSPFDVISKGASAVTKDASTMGQFAKDNWKNIAAAAGPAIMAGANVGAKGPQTVTKPGMIRPFSFDPYGGTYTAGTPYEAAPTRAAEGGLMGMAQGGGMFDFVQRSEPVVRMAEGGIAGYAVGGAPTMLSDEELFKQTGSWEAAAALRDQQNNALNQYNWAQQAAAAPVAAPVAEAPKYNTFSNEEIGAYLRSNPDVDIAKAIKDFNADPTAVNAYVSSLAGGYKDPTATAGGSGTLGIYNQLKAAGIDAGELYAAQPQGWSQADIQRQMDFDKGAYGLAAAMPQGVSDKNWAQWMDANNYSVLDAAKAFGLPIDEVQRRYDAAKKEEKKTTGIAALTGGAGTTEPMNVAGPTTTTVLPTTPRTNAPAGTSNPYGNVNNPGDLTFNPDGTVTVTPNIPGRPYGGFSGIDEVKGAYTGGGGSLGYVPYTPKTIEEFDAKYNKLTGGSKQAYDYLMGKTPYSPVPYTPTGEIQKPYWESVGRYPVNLATKKYIYQNGKYVLNPDYVKPPYVLAAEKAAAAKDTAASNAASGKFITVLDAQGYPEQAYMRDDGFYYTSGGAKFDEKGAQVAAGGGLMAMAAGGSASYNLGDYSDGGRLLRGPGDGVSDSIPASIGNKRPARLADGEFVVPARIVSELGNGSTEAGARKLYAMMDRVQAARRGTVGKGKVAKNSRADKHLPV